jgi:hypothetical protein
VISFVPRSGLDSQSARQRLIGLSEFNF